MPGSNNLLSQETPTSKRCGRVIVAVQAIPHAAMFADQNVIGGLLRHAVRSTTSNSDRLHAHAPNYVTDAGLRLDHLLCRLGGPAALDGPAVVQDSSDQIPGGFSVKRMAQAAQLDRSKMLQVAP